MKIIDEKGRLFGRVSIIDILIVLAVIGLGLGFIYKRISPEVMQIVNADATFYVTLATNRLRSFSVEAISEGDLMFKQHDRQSLGRIVKLEIKPATDYLLRPDGTAELAEMEDRYQTFITVQCTGAITDAGYYVNGSMHIAEGSEMVLVSNRVILPDSVIYTISETMP
jgi:hypothetical protein